MKLMDIASDTLSIPTRTTTPSSEFSCFVCDLSHLIWRVCTEASEGGTRFASDEEPADRIVLLNLKQMQTARVCEEEDLGDVEMGEEEHGE
jgi:hypothetical protein